MNSLSMGLLIGLLAVLPTAAEACRIAADDTAYRPAVSRTAGAVMIEQADRLVIVLAGGRGVEQVKTFENAKSGAGHAMPVQVTIAADANGEGGAIVWVDDGKVRATGEATIESIPRPHGLGSCESSSDAAIPTFSNHLQALAANIIDHARALSRQLRGGASIAIAIGAAIEELIDTAAYDLPTWFDRRG